MLLTVPFKSFFLESALLGVGLIGATYSWEIRRTLEGTTILGSLSDYFSRTGENYFYCVFTAAP